jgi:uncharacterized membrane protein
VSTSLEQAKEPVAPFLSGPCGHPFHPMLVTVPIGAWVCSLVFDVASRVVDSPNFLAEGSEWLIAIGVVGAVAAAIIGFLDLIAIPPKTSAFRTGLIHMTLNLSVTAAYAANFVWRQGTYANRHAVEVGPLVLSLISIVGLAVAGFLGGKLAYHFGVRVVREVDQARAFQS